MLTRSQFVVLGPVAVALGLGGCDITSLDNYGQPSSTLTGQIVYQGKPVGVRNAGIELEVWQPGFDFETKIPVYVAQDGSFSAVLFDGSYEINLIAGSPWVDDTERMGFELRGKKTIEIPVVPYYTVESEDITNNNDVMRATFTVGQVETSRAVQRVGIYVNTTSIVDRNHQVVRTELSGSAIGNLNAPISLSVKLPDNIRLTPSPEPRANVFVRVGVQAAGVGEMVYSQVRKIGL